MSAEQQQNKPMRYGDLDDDDDILSDDEPGRVDGGEDDEFLKQQHAQDAAAAQALPHNVKNFITSLRSAMASSNVAQIHTLYANAFQRLTQEHYASQEWPEVEVVSCLVEGPGSEVFGIFYKELYYRHVYSRLQPTLDDRFQSYENYCAIFNYILNSDGPVAMELPVQWLWDLVDEFVWQFASFAQWRSRPKGKTEDEISLLAENPQVWSCYSVLNVLYSLIQKSKIQDQLRASKKGEEPEEVAGEYGSKPLYKMLGLYSMITLVRVHALLGDYTLALKMLDDVDMKKLPTRDVPAAHVCVHYYVGFSYLMIQRYADAIYHLSKGYLFHAGPKRSRVSGNDAVAKQADRMLALLAVAHALSPTKWDDSREVREAREALRASEKYNEQCDTMSRGKETSLPVFEEVFKYGAPKTISPHSPPYDNPELLETYDSDNISASTVNLFMQDVRIVKDIPDLRTLLKLYTSISTSKLASLSTSSGSGASAMSEDELIRQLMILKGSMKAVKWSAEISKSLVEGTGESTGLLSGEESIAGSLSFAIDGSTIHVTEQKRARQFTGRFLSQGLAAKQILDQLKARPLPNPVYSNATSSNSASTDAPKPVAAPILKSNPSTQSYASQRGEQKGVAWAASKA